MQRFEGVANTLFVPLSARIAVSKEFPEYFMDRKALELEPYLPAGSGRGSSQYSNMASAARYYNMDQMVAAFAERNPECSVVFLGVGLETAYDRLHGKLPGVRWYECDLPEVIAARQQVLGQRECETLIPGDMFLMEWTDTIDRSLPVLLIVSGVFQYFHEAEVIGFIKKCSTAFPNAELIFDATSTLGLLYTNRFIRRTGNGGALMYFGVDDCSGFARSCGAVLLEERIFFQDALKLLGRKLNLMTRISMKTADRRKLALILHLKLPDGRR